MAPPLHSSQIDILANCKDLISNAPQSKGYMIGETLSWLANLDAAVNGSWTVSGAMFLGSVANWRCRAWKRAWRI
ncbi:hypothetical protein ACLOJK_009461 [Asimina triloba]